MAAIQDGGYLLPDGLAKCQLLARMRKRHENLEQLQSHDVEKFNWLCAELQITFMPPEPPKLSKREVRQKAARDATEALIVQKTEQLRKRFVEEKAKFDEYRRAELADIEQSLKEFGVEMTSLEQTLTDLGFGELVPRPEPWRSLEERMEQRRVAQLMELKKQKDAEILRANGFIVPKHLLS